MTDMQRYHSDPAYRKWHKALVAANHKKNKTDPVWLKLRATRVRIQGARRSIEHHESRAAFFMKRLEADLRLLEKQKHDYTLKRRTKANV